MYKLMNKIYPLLSIGVIELGTFFQNANNIISLLIFSIQLLIGILTILKLYKEIKINRTTKTTEEIEKELTTKNKLLVAILSVLKNFRNK